MFIPTYNFAYGSNMCQDRLEYRVGKVEKAGNYELKGFKLEFNSSGFANIIKGEKDDSVEGVLYKLTPKQGKRLDEYEGLYVREFFKLDDGRIAYTYVSYPSYSKWERFISKPSLEYVNYLLDGALENGLIKTYNQILKFKLNVLKVKNSRHKYI